MAENPNPSRHVSYEQVKIIIDFMGKHVEFATGSLRSLEARHTSKSLWNELTKILNNTRSGAKKTCDGWSKYWSDFKNKLKNKVNILKKTKRSVSSPKRNIKQLTRLEKRALVILGPHFERKICKESADPFINVSQNPYPPEVKLEVCHDNGHNAFRNSLSESSDRLSDESNDSEDSNDEFDDNSDTNSNEPVISSMYPKWLIEIEKKRTDADHRRAKAEEQRANVSAKNSEAALAQAEALKKLADAAVIQAEALAKIAAVMERHKQMEDSVVI